MAIERNFIRLSGDRGIEKKSTTLRTRCSKLQSFRNMIRAQVFFFFVFVVGCRNIYVSSSGKTRSFCTRARYVGLRSPSVENCNTINPVRVHRAFCRRPLLVANGPLHVFLFSSTVYSSFRSTAAENAKIETFGR